MVSNKKMPEKPLVKESVFMKASCIAFITFLFPVLFSAQKGSCYDLEEVLKVEPTPLYANHLTASKKFNIKILKNSSSVNQYKESGKLTSVKELGKGYRIRKLEHSRAVLVPKAKTMLREIAKTFSGKTKGSTLTYTSLTRTLEDQCKLRKVNSNASIGLSSHNYGNSFDVSYVRFNDRLERNERLEKILELVLKDYEKAGKIYYIKEKQQSCYHVTVRA